MTDTTIDTVETVEGSVELELARDRSLFHASDPVEVLAAAKRVAGALKAEIAAAGMVQRIGGREHVRVEGWQTLGAMLGCSTRIVWSRPVEDGWEARAEVVSADGRIIGAGEGMCTRAERNWAKRDAFALRSMAQTRATSRALRVPLAFVMTLAGHDATPAEEMTVETVEPEPAALPAWARPADVPAASRTVVEFLSAAGVPEPAKATATIGQRIFDRCDNTIPVAVHRVLEEVRDVILAARREDAS